RSNLLSIAAAIRRSSDSGQRELEDVESLRRRLLKEAEQRLMRYRMLGLGSHRKDLAFAAIATKEPDDSASHHETAAEPDSDGDAGPAGNGPSVAITRVDGDADPSSSRPGAAGSSASQPRPPAQHKRCAVGILKHHDAATLGQGSRKSPR